MKKIILSLSLLAALLLPAARAQVVAGSQIIIGNIGSYESASNTDSVVNYTGTVYNWKDIGFTMGSTAYNVSGLTLYLNVSSTAAPVVAIYASNVGGTYPTSTLVGSFTDPTFTPSTVGEYTFTPTSTITLNASTTYYIVVQQSGSSTSFEWMIGSSGNTSSSVAGSGATVGNAPYVDNAVSLSVTTASSGTSSNYNWFELDGTVSAIPEPSTYAAVLGAFAGLVVFVKRFRRRKN